MEGNKRATPIPCGRKETAWWLALTNRIFLCVTAFFLCDRLICDRG